ncbi:MAG TPA: SGNH/GDSL hydrolase family protein [Mycobacteriales bacterium]|nr:SGNH/GDSL hydrolase family protein [Mycobacteriales bacterium]
MPQQQPETPEPRSVRYRRIVLTTAILAATGTVAINVASPAVSPVDRITTVVTGPHLARGAQPAATTLVGLGDSVPAASGCDCTSFVAGYGARLADRTGGPVIVHNLSVPGQTSADLLAGLATGQPAAAAVAQAAVVTVTVGANDFRDQAAAIQDDDCGGDDDLDCTADTLASMRQTLGAVLDRIKSLHGRRPVAIALTGYWAVFEDGAIAQQLYSPVVLRRYDELTRRVNAAIVGVARAAHAAYVDLYAAFKGTDGQADDTRLLAPDGDHPDQDGHDLIADALLASLSG